MKDELVGVLKKEICEQWNLEEHIGKPIIKGKDWKEKHGEKHINEFKCIYNYEKAVEKIPLILDEPDYTFYNEEEKGLEYFKKIEENVTLIVRVTQKRKFYLATIYPSTKTKLGNRKIKEIEKNETLIDKYRYKGNSF